MFLYTVKYNESEYHTQNNNLLYKIHQTCQNTFKQNQFFKTFQTKTKKTTKPLLFCILYILYIVAPCWLPFGSMLVVLCTLRDRSWTFLTFKFAPSSPESVKHLQNNRTHPRQNNYTLPEPRAKPCRRNFVFTATELLRQKYMDQEALFAETPAVV